MNSAINGKPRIDHVIPAQGIGGVEVAAATSANRSDLDCDVRLIFMDDGGQSNSGSIARWLPAPIQNLVATVTRLRRDPPDLLLASLWKTAPILAVFRLLPDRPRLVFFLHSAREWHVADWLFSRVSIRLADEVWADSAATLSARAVPAAKPTRIVSFVTDQFAEEMNREVAPRFVSWGRLHSAKAYDRAVRFIALLASNGIDAQFDLFGPDAGEGTRLRALVEAIGIQDRVRFRGPISQTELDQAAVGQAFFLQTSRSEGMCMAVVEAMQLGLVPIATAVGEMAHYIHPGKTGIVFDPNSPEIASARVAELLGNSAQYQRLSAAARGYWRSKPSYAQDLCRAALESIRANRQCAKIN